MDRDEKYMRMALALARRGRGKTSPNPMVGAVVVRGNAVVGKGYHHRAGEPHAEVLALRQAGKKAKGATLYLNLEPCDHFGKTPPCTQAILGAGLKRVVAGMKDPNPRVSGRGIRRLRRAGVRVEVGLLEGECRELNAAFCKFIRTRKPFVILKAAVSLDGKVATRSGDSRWVSGQESRSYVHRLRSAVDGVMAGIGTVLRDDPLLNVRRSGKRAVRQPLRVIVDSTLRLPLRSRIAQTASQFRTLVATTPAAAPAQVRRLQRANVEVLIVKNRRNGKVSLGALMEELGRRGILSVLLEGGPTLSASALQEKIVDRILLFVAPKIIGGTESLGAIGGRGILRMREALKVEILRVRRTGPDLMIEGKPLYG
ncbi:MAG: bifunctional diaminohydroxyphosphoribosylaminopyrimidine deaminase/5-amino-6-(5-phosphoribosylamino)uracil reductase RibD [Syntrophaceae bacterium]|nr:bifunctional diaminohydroxyphosphoribosylaminopyrimidine deaminase/5-amino-6-(5-phosphoribosylamino)uracil reductase RibD [Syntrophaceae bacterium]